MADEVWMRDRGWTILRSEKNGSLIGVKIQNGTLRIWEVDNEAEFNSETVFNAEETARLAEWLKPLAKETG
jgi:hypothetical protein